MESLNSTSPTEKQPRVISWEEQLQDHTRKLEEYLQNLLFRGCTLETTIRSSRAVLKHLFDRVQIEDPTHARGRRQLLVWELLNPALGLVVALRESLGSSAKLVALEDALQILKAARVDATNAQVNSVAGYSLMIDGLLSPTEYGEALLRAIGIVLHEGMFIDEVTELIEAVESRCWKLAEEETPNDVARSLTYKNNLFQRLYVVVPRRGPDCFPVSLLVHAFKNIGWSAKNGRFKTPFHRTRQRYPESAIWFALSIL